MPDREVVCPCRLKQQFEWTRTSPRSSTPSRCAASIPRRTRALLRAYARTRPVRKRCGHPAMGEGGHGRTADHRAIHGGLGRSRASSLAFAGKSQACAQSPWLAGSLASWRSILHRACEHAAECGAPSMRREEPLLGCRPAVCRRCFGCISSGKVSRPASAIAAPDPHCHAVLPHDHANAIVLELVDPLPADRNLAGRGDKAGAEWRKPVPGERGTHQHGKGTYHPFFDAVGLAVPSLQRRTASDLSIRSAPLRRK
jgi:hypothetical protein